MRNTKFKAIKHSNKITFQAAKLSYPHLRDACLFGKKVSCLSGVRNFPTWFIFLPHTDEVSYFGKYDTSPISRTFWTGLAPPWNDNLIPTSVYVSNISRSTKEENFHIPGNTCWAHRHARPWTRKLELKTSIAHCIPQAWSLVWRWTQLATMKWVGNCKTLSTKIELCIVRKPYKNTV